MNRLQGLLKRLNEFSAIPNPNLFNETETLYKADDERDLNNLYIELGVEQVLRGFLTKGGNFYFSSPREMHTSVWKQYKKLLGQNPYNIYYSSYKKHVRAVETLFPGKWNKARPVFVITRPCFSGEWDGFSEKEIKNIFIKSIKKLGFSTFCLLTWSPDLKERNVLGLIYSGGKEKHRATTPDVKGRDMLCL